MTKGRYGGFAYCDFFDSAVDDKPMNVGDAPRIFGKFNVAWPPGWTDEEAKKYRREHGLLADDT